jgi:HK97 family phage major capsid protein
MSEHNDELGAITHTYRKALDAYAARTGLKTETVDTRGSGSEKEMFAKMDNDLTATELRAQNAAVLARLAKIEAQPQFVARAAGAALADRDNPDSAAYAARWLSAAARGDLSEFRALATGGTGVATPTDLERRIVTKLQQSSVLRSLGKVSTIDSKRTIAVEGALPTSNIVAEGGAITAADPTFATQISINPIKFVCATTMTQEFIDDVIGTGGIGTGMQYVADRCGMSLAKILDQYYTIGTGVTTQPQGIADTTGTAFATTNVQNIIAQGVTLADDALIDTITGDNIIDCVHAVPVQYRSGNFRILTSDTVIKNVRKIKVSGTDYVWKIGSEGGIAGGTPATIYGVPYSIGAYMPIVQGGTLTTANVRGAAYFIVGNWDYFEIFDRSGMTSMIDPYSAAATQQSTLYVHMRTDSHIMLPEAFACISAVNTA